jgi:hypothetical protein
MRHPAAPVVVALLLGLLGVLMLWGKWRGDGHHEGNPHPDDVPKKGDGEKATTKKEQENK